MTEPSNVRRPIWQGWQDVAALWFAADWLSPAERTCASSPVSTAPGWKP